MNSPSANGRCSHGIEFWARCEQCELDSEAERPATPSSNVSCVCVPIEDRPCDSCKLEAIDKLLERMIASAEVYTDAEDTVTGYKIKTGALHRLIGLRNLSVPQNLPVVADEPRAKHECADWSLTGEGTCSTCWKPMTGSDCDPRDQSIPHAGCICPICDQARWRIVSAQPPSATLVCGECGHDNSRKDCINCGAGLRTTGVQKRLQDAETILRSWLKDNRVADGRAFATRAWLDGDALTKIAPPGDRCSECDQPLPPVAMWSMPACPICVEKAERADETRACPFGDHSALSGNYCQHCGARVPRCSATFTGQEDKYHCSMYNNHEGAHRDGDVVWGYRETSVTPGAVQDAITSAYRKTHPWKCACGQLNADWAAECGRCERGPPSEGASR